MVSTYGLLYSVILHSALRELSVLNGQAQKLSNGMHAGVVQSLREKGKRFRCFLMLLLVEIVLEAVSRYILVSQVWSFFSLVLMYELASTVVLACMGSCFTPRRQSPFYFIVPTSLEVGEGANPNHTAGAAGAGTDDENEIVGEDEETRRVRRALTRRHRVHDHWEDNEDGAGLERLRFARSQR